MRITAIGDGHGRTSWKSVDPNSCDKIVMLGDYLDSFDVNNVDITNNLLDIIQFKKDNMDKVILLLGNHELHYRYLGDWRMMCSGHRPKIAQDLHYILLENKDLFQSAYQYKDTIFTHAGIQHDWFVNVFKGDELQVDYSIAEQLNDPVDKAQEDALYRVGYMRGGMRGDVGGIFWCDREELKKPLEGFAQVVGHTPVKEPIKYTRGNAEVWFCDCLGSKKEFLTLEL